MKLTYATTLLLTTLTLASPAPAPEAHPLANAEAAAVPALNTDALPREPRSLADIIIARSPDAEAQPEVLEADPNFLNLPKRSPKKPKIPKNKNNTNSTGGAGDFLRPVWLWEVAGVAVAGAVGLGGGL